MKYLSLIPVCLLLFSACDNDSGLDGPDADASTDAPADAAVGDAFDAHVSDVGDARSDASDAGFDGSVVDDALRPPQLDLRFDGLYPLKALVQGRIFAVVLDRPLNLRTELGYPSRSIRWLKTDGAVIRSRGSSGMRYLLDAALHPSGEFTLLFATKDGSSLERTNETGEVLGVWDVQDPLIDTDLPQVPPPAGPITKATYDTGRIAAQGEVVVLATRTGRNSVIAYRVGYGGGDAFSLLSRALVVPPLSIPPLGLTGGSYDTFGLVNAQYAVHLAVGPDGLIYVGVRYPDIATAQILKVHKAVFGETLMGDPDAWDSYVTRLSPAGGRLGTSVITTMGADELQSLRAVDGGAYVVGRTEHWNAQGTGFDVLVAKIDGGTGAVKTRELDVNAGDIAFDLLPLDENTVVVVGASGYAQNPNGLSITESSQGFARKWPEVGETTSLALPQGLRHNEARFVLGYGDAQLLIGGMLNGPGTHSADGDASLLRADGFLVTLPVPR
ncbi:MAG: hypothetical protein SF187_29135 [Deltaproteobacteria bacterium]|nr:hypothetical protein [Deltaproteobacteria bacterium]